MRQSHRYHRDMRVLMILAMALIGCWPLAARLGAADDTAPTTIPAAPAEAAPTGEAPAPKPGPATVAYIPIDSAIDSHQERYFRRALGEAKAAGVTTVVVHLNTDGGTVDAGRKMMALALETKGHPRMIAFVDNRCYSAGSLIAYGHDEILLTPGATIGDIGVIFIGADGKMEYAPEKQESVVRTLLRSAAQAKGWNEAKLLKMTARNQELYRFDLHGKQDFVIEDNLPAWLNKHPDVDPGSKIVILGKDRLRSYTAREAVEDGMATALVDDLDGAYKRLGVKRSEVLDLSPTRVEEISWQLAALAPILASLAALCVFLEFKSQGIGIWTALAVMFGAAFFVCQFYQDLASYIEPILVVVGILCIVIELFVFPTMGWLAVLGVMISLSGLVLAFMPDTQQFHPSVDGWGHDLGSAIQQSVLAMAVITVGAVVIIATFPNSRAMRAMAATAEITGTSANASELAGSLVGKRALARTPLSPSGSITVDGRDLTATTEHGEFLQVGAEVQVVGMRYGGAVVRAIPAADGGARA